MKNICIIIGLVAASTILPSYAIASEANTSLAPHTGYTQHIDAQTELSEPRLAPQAPQPAQASHSQSSEKPAVQKPQASLRRVVVRKTPTRANNTFYADSRGRVIYSDLAPGSEMPVYVQQEKAAAMPNHFK